MEIRDLPDKGPRLAAWDMSLDGALAQIRDRFVAHYEDTAMWGFSTWLDLTEAGERIARELERKTAE